ncbi:MAG TPA: M61 family peptidase [Thermoanaerobaculia bacterium]|nr:M61 family peptidase [Thermoanaerobaculia bacterium]
MPEIFRKSAFFRTLSSIALVSLVVFAASAPLKAQGTFGPIRLSVDATQAPQKILHAHMQLPVQQGPLTLLYAKWIPGEHMPDGPIINVAGLKFSGGGKTIAWRRDLTQMFALHLDVPSGVSSLDVDLDFLLSAPASGYSAGASATAFLDVLSWNQIVLYPQGYPANKITVIPSVTLPAGWKFGTALPVSRAGDGRVEFAPASLTTLIDSPVLLGAHMKTFPLTTEPPVHEIDAAADGEAALAAPADFASQYSSLVAEAEALFGAHHYRDYHFLLTLSDHTAHFGLEHHESSDDRIDEQALLKDDLRRSLAGLLAHEFIHSWNGKYRRPGDLLSPDLQTPMQGDLLWVYEGLTQYLSFLLPPRSGLWTPDYTHEQIAKITGELDHETGRTWRPLEDTAVASQTLLGQPIGWRAWRRGASYYDESVLIWLEVDTLLRERTGGKVSMDDFCHRFHGGTSGPPEVKPYTFEEVVAILNGLLPYDWKGFFNARLTSTAPQAPRGGLAASGWKLTYSDVPNQAVKDREERLKFNDWTYSLGLAIQEDGTILDTITDSPAARAGIGPSMKLIAVNGRAFKPEWMEAALREAKGSPAAIELLVENNEYYKTFRVDYHEGPRYPHLEKQPGQPDLLSQILAPHAPPRVP